MSDYGTMSGSGAGYGEEGGVRFAGFSPTELFSLTEAVAGNVTALGGAVRALEKATRHLGSHKDSRQLRDKAHETQQNIKEVIATTTKDLRRLTTLVRRGDKGQKLQVEKLGHSFTESLNKYLATEKLYSEKLKMHMTKIHSTDYQENMSMEDDETARLLAQKQEENRILEFETGILEERASYIRQIETNVIDVNQMMQEFGSIIHAQGQTIDTIESSIEAAGNNVEVGNEELLKASRYQAKFRRKVVILVGIAVTVGIILTIIIVTSLKS